MIRSRADGVVTYLDGREVCLRSAPGLREYRRRVMKMWERQEGRCCSCQKPMGTAEATFGHESSRGMGGGKRDDRIEAYGKWKNGAQCIDCQSKQGSKPEKYACNTTHNARC